tara:strand:+ start:521 stop:1660 length:1140 start_codon:yes stop_codon:yes gene_type:complete
MIKWLFKYGLVFYLFNTILLSIESTFDIGFNIFLGIMTLYSMLFLINPKQVKYIISNKAFTFLLLLTILNFIYFMVFDNVTDIESIKYLLARSLQFAIISFSIYHNIEYYKDKFLSHLIYLVFIIIAISLFLDISIFSGRYSGIIWNPNMLSSFTTISFAVLLLKNEEKTKFEYFLLALFLIISLATGSRGVLVGIVLSFIIRFGFSVRNIMYAILSIGVYTLMLEFNINTSLNRFGTQSLFNDRTLQYYYAFETFLQKPIAGWGLGKYAFINRELIPLHLKGYNISSHNGYLAIIVQYGIIFSALFFFIVFKKSLTLLYYFRNSKTGYEAIYSFLLIYALFASFYETMITGINEFHTILFWFALAILSFEKQKTQNES